VGGGPLVQQAAGVKWAFAHEPLAKLYARHNEIDKALASDKIWTVVEFKNVPFRKTISSQPSNWRQHYSTACFWQLVDNLGICIWMLETAPGCLIVVFGIRMMKSAVTRKLIGRACESTPHKSGRWTLDFAGDLQPIGTKPTCKLYFTS
jgi:hypothetical protein